MRWRDLVRSHLEDFHFDVMLSSFITDEVKINYSDGYFNASVEFDPIEVVWNCDFGAFG